MAAVNILSDARRKKDERSKEICSSCTQCSNGIFHGRKRIRSSEVESKDDLAGATIGVQLGTTGDLDASDYEKDGSTVESL